MLIGNKNSYFCDMRELDILFRDEHVVVVNKPNKLLVHRSRESEDRMFALQIVRNQLDQKVYPAHRLDRATSGCLLFSLSPELDKVVKKEFQEHKTKKTYHVIVRGFLEEKEGTIAIPLKNPTSGNLQDSITHYKVLDECQMDIPVPNYTASRFSLVEVELETGRFHQIRKHFAKIRHYVIGDKRHGDTKYNKLVRMNFDLDYMFLHASKLEFTHPVSGDKKVIVAPMRRPFEKMLESLGWDFSLEEYYKDVEKSNNSTYIGIN